VGFNDEEEADVFELSAGPSKPEEYSTETNVFSVEFDASEVRRAEPAQAAPPPVPVSASAPAPADDDDEFDFSGGVSSATIDDDDDFPVEGAGVFSKIKGMFATPDDDLDDDVDFDVDVDVSADVEADVDLDDDADVDGDFSDDDDFPAESGGFFAKIKGMFAKPDDDLDDDVDFDDDVDVGADIEVDVDLDDDVDVDVGGDFSDDDEFPAEKGGFFSKIKGAFAKSEDDIDDFDDDLPDDYTPVLDEDDGGDDVFDLSHSAVTLQAEPEFEAAGPKSKPVKTEIFEVAEPKSKPVKTEVFDVAEPEFETVKVEFEAAEPEFEAVKTAFEAFGSEPEPAFQEAKPSGEDDEFDLSANVPPPAPALLPPPVFSRFAHVCLRVKNLGASADFYAKLGFTKRFAFNKNGRLFGVYLEFGSGNFVELFEDARRNLSPKNGRLAHFCLETPDIDAAMESLSSRGIEYTPKKLGTDATYQIWLKDPDGNEFEIHQYTPESSQFTGKNVEADW